MKYLYLIMQLVHYALGTAETLSASMDRSQEIRIEMSRDSLGLFISRESERAAQNRQNHENPQICENPGRSNRIA